MRFFHKQKGPGEKPGPFLLLAMRQTKMRLELARAQVLAAGDAVQRMAFSIMR